MPTFSSYNAVDLSALQEANVVFGYEEKLLTGSLDTTNEWTEVVANTGASSMENNGLIKLTTGATNASVIAETLKRSFNITSDSIGVGQQFSKFVVEWDLKVYAVANVDNATFFMGLVSLTADTRASNNCTGFILVSDAVNTLTDVAGAEVINVASGVTVTNQNTYRIEHDGTSAVFKVNGVIVATHASAPSSRFFKVYLKNDSANETIIYPTHARAWFE